MDETKRPIPNLVDEFWKNKLRERGWKEAHLRLLPPPPGRKLSPIFELLRSPGIDSKELIPPAYVAWQAGTITLFLLGS